MKNVLWVLLVFLLGLFGFGFYKHTFDFNAYVMYLRTEGATNFSLYFSPADPSTWLSFLYDAQAEKKEQQTLLEKELAKINELTNFEETGSIISGSSVSGEIILSGEDIRDSNSGQDLSTLSTGITELISGGESSGEEKDPFSDFSDFFGITGESIVGEIGSGEISGDEEPDSSFDLSGKTTNEAIPETTAPVSEEESSISSGSTSNTDSSPGIENLIDQQVGEELDGLYTGVLLKRLRQYQSFKKTLQ